MKRIMTGAGIIACFAAAGMVSAAQLVLQAKAPGVGGYNHAEIRGEGGQGDSRNDHNTDLWELKLNNCNS